MLHQSRKKERLQQHMFYRYHLRLRTAFSALFYGHRLFQQYLVDAWAACDQNKLSWHRHHQAALCTKVYNSLSNALVQEDVNANELGHRIILPANYAGGDRYMQQLFQDSMAIVRHFGRSTLFITFTANSSWIEIKRELRLGQSAVD